MTTTSTSFGSTSHLFETCLTWIHFLSAHSPTASIFKFDFKLKKKKSLVVKQILVSECMRVKPGQTFTAFFRQM